MNVDPQAYYDTAAVCARASESVRSRVEALRGSLSKCTAMVGGYDSVNQWGTAYDQSTYDFFHAAEVWVDASSKLAEVTTAAGYNWVVAEHTAHPSPGPGPGPPAPPQTSSYLQCMVPPPSSLGHNGDGLDTDVPGLLEQIGLPVPDGDSDKLTIAADAWRAFAEHADTTAAARDIRGAVDLFDGFDAPDVAAVTAHLETLRRSADKLVSTASALASPVAAHNMAVTDLRTGIKASSDELAWTLGAIGAVTAVAAIATVLLTGGLGALGPAQAEVAAGAAGTTAAIATAANAIRGLLIASALAALLGSATATFAAVNGVTTVSALEVITMLVVQHLPGDDANAVPSYTSPTPGNPEYEARREGLAKDPAKGGQSNPQSEREADVGLEAESAGVIPGPIIRAPLSEDGKDQGEFVDAAGEHWDVKSSPDIQPSYRPDSGKPIEPSQSDTEFDRMINKQLNKGTGVLLDSDGMTAARETHLRDLVSQHPEWAGKVRWSS